MKRSRLVFVTLFGILAALLTVTHREDLVAHVYANQAEETQASNESLAQPPAWLHVEVETSYGWFWQTSKGRAWVTAGKQDTLPVKVGNLCIRLQSHDLSQRCEQNTAEIAIIEKKRGVQIRKRTAIVTAWAESPALDTMRVKMEP